MQSNPNMSNQFNLSLFEEIATLSGLTARDTFICLSPSQIFRLVNSMECLTQNAVNAFVKKYAELSGDVYVALTADNNFEEVLAIDIVRPDDPSRTSCYVMDQDPIYISKHINGWGASNQSVKVNHLDSSGRSFLASAYYPLSSFLRDKKDKLLYWDEVAAIDPGIYNAISKGLDVVSQNLDH